MKIKNISFSHIEINSWLEVLKIKGNAAESSGRGACNMRVQVLLHYSRFLCLIRA